MVNGLFVLPNLQNVFNFLVIIYISFCFAEVNGQAGNQGNTKLYNDEKLFFSIKFPSDWKESHQINPNSKLKFFAESNDNKHSVYIYVFETDGTIVLENFSNIDTLLFNNLGHLIEIQNRKKLGIVTERIEKTFLKKDRKIKILYETEDNLGYIIVWQSFDNDSSSYLKISESFKLAAPVLLTFRMLLSKLSSGIWGVIYSISGFIIMFAIGFLGHLIKRGVSIKKAIPEVLNEYLKKGVDVSKDLNQVKTKSTAMILLPLVMLFVLYVLLFFNFSINTFLISLCGLIPLILGYFGIVLIPDID